MLEEQVPLGNYTAIEDVIESLQTSDSDDLHVVKMICIIHPYVDDPAGFRDDMDAPVNHTAHVTYQDVPESVAAWEGDELACFYCGEKQVMILNTCGRCEKHMCDTCLKATGGSCSCYLTDEKIVELDNFKPSPNQDKITTFKKKQKRIVRDGADLVKKQDKAMWSALTNSATNKCLLAVTLCAAVFQGAIGHNTTFFNPGAKASNCDDAGIERLNDIANHDNPSLIYIQMPFEKDEENSDGHSRLTAFAKAQSEAGRTCVIADSRHTGRWNDTNTKPVLCRGDLAFRCDDPTVTKELLEWSRRRENGNPRCVEDLDEVQFADIIGSIAETHHLDRVVDTAFVGTEEADAERIPIDAIEEEKDRAMQDNAEAYDDEQDLLERIPLPGDPTGERDRKTKWLALPRRARTVSYTHLTLPTILLV